jgi:3-hydroxyisobutyrate dehydrogenase
MFLQASACGLGGEDDSAVIKIFPGIDLPQPADRPQPTHQPKKED